MSHIPQFAKDLPHYSCSKISSNEQEFTYLEDGIYQYKNVTINIIPTIFNYSFISLPKWVTYNWNAALDTKYYFRLQNLASIGVILEREWITVKNKSLIKMDKASFEISLGQLQSLKSIAYQSYLSDKPIGERLVLDITYYYKKGEIPYVYIVTKGFHTTETKLPDALETGIRTLLNQRSFLPKKAKAEDIRWNKTNGFIPIEEALTYKEITHACYIWCGTNTQTHEFVVYTGIVGDRNGSKNRSLAKRLAEHIQYHQKKKIPIKITHCFFMSLVSAPNTISIPSLLRTCEARLQDTLAVCYPSDAQYENNPQFTSLGTVLNGKTPKIINDKFNYHTTKC